MPEFRSVNPLIFSTLKLLAGAQFRSGEEMARTLGVSRATIWNAIKELDNLGIGVFKVPGKGYKLAESLSLLDETKIKNALGDKAGQFEIEIHEVLESTNTLLMQKAVLGVNQGACIAAELQTAGRGRRGRVWHGNLGGTITYSVLWRFRQGATALQGLSLAVGVALLRTLKEQGIGQAGLKWPNDVVHHFRKLAGILIELQGDVLGPCTAIIGVGLNLRLSEVAKNSIDQAVVDIYNITGIVPDRNELLAASLRHMHDVLTQFELEGFGAFKEEWVNAHVYHNKRVRLTSPGGHGEHGRVTGIDMDGALLVETISGIQRFNAGEISLRGET